MSEPTNVTSSTNVSESGSRRSPAASESWPAETHVNRSVSTTRSAAGACRSDTRMAAPSTNAAAEAATPSQWPHRSERRPASSRIPADTSGIATSSQAYSWDQSLGAVGAAMSARGRRAAIRVGTLIPSVPQQVDVVHRGGPAGTEDRDDDREADDDLGGRDDHHEEGEHLAVQVAVHPRERDEREVRRVEHELDPHEHDDPVAAQQHRRGPDREQERGEHEVVGQAHCRAPPSCSSRSSVVVRCWSSGTAVCSAPGWRAYRETSSSWPRIRRMRETESSIGRPSGSSAGTSIALWRA